MDKREPYLWDRTGTPDDEVDRLERALAPLRFSGAARRDGEPRSVSRRPQRRWIAAAIAAAAVVVLAVTLWNQRAGEELRLAVADGGELLREGSSFVATADGQKLELTGYAEITLAAGSRLDVEQLAPDETRLFLHRGEMQAFVNVDVKERFFQVGTPAARCVDLGCLYDLTVDDDGTAHVVVTLGRVAFENNGRDVFIPARAECWADPERGAGTPRFVDSPAEMRRALDAFDRARDEPPAQRLARLRAVLASATDVPASEHALPLWHISGDADPAIAAAAIEALGDRHGRPAELDAAPGQKPTAADRIRWRTHLRIDPFE